MPERQTRGRRWWRYKRTWLIGAPVVLVLGVVGLFVWGSFQPKPAGFAPTDPDQVVASSQVASPSEEVAPSEEPVSSEAAAPFEEWVRFTVDAKSKQDWVLFDFDQGRVVDGDFTVPDWDVAFKRTKLLTNSGVTNPSGHGGAYDLGEVPLEDATPPASVVFAVDVLGGEDEDEPENPAIGRWYKYSFIKHVVSVKPNTYLVRTGEDQNALVQFDSYYCDDEEAACITFRYRLIPGVADASTDVSS